MTYPTLLTTPDLPAFASAVDTERQAQLAKWGDQRHADGTGAEYYVGMADQARDEVQRFVAQHSGPEWALILLEEVYEALAESDPAKLRAELIQAAAVIAAWVSDLDRRAPRTGDAPADASPTGRFSCTSPCVRGVCGMAWTDDRCGQCCECRLTCDGPPQPADGLPERYAAAMREHYIVSDRGEADADGNMPCRCGDWREGGDADEYDWDHHLATAVLAVRDSELRELRTRAEDAKAKLAAVRALHQVATGVGWNPDGDSTPGAYGDIEQACATCGTVGEYAVRWPCPTITAADGPQPIDEDRVLGQARITQAEAERDGAYRERAQLLAWLAVLRPATTVIAPAPDIDEPADMTGWQMLYLVVGGQQMTWHIHPRDAHLFDHVEHVGVDDARAVWDGHSTDQKYERMRSHIRSLAHTPTAGTVQHARRFAIRCADNPDIHGIEFPSGRVLADHGETGLFAATSVDVLTEDGGTVHWADDTRPSFTTTPEPTP